MDSRLLKTGLFMYCFRAPLSSAQHVALHHPKDGYVGIICKNCRPIEVINAAVDDASFMCRRTFGDAPDVVVYGDENFG